MATLTVELPEQVTQGQMIQALESLGCNLRLAGDGRNYVAVPKAGQAPENSGIVRQHERGAA